MWLFFAQLWFWVWLLSALGLATFALHSYHYHYHWSPHRTPAVSVDYNNACATINQQKRAFRSGDFIGYVLPLTLYKYISRK